MEVFIKVNEVVECEVVAEHILHVLSQESR